MIMSELLEEKDRVQIKLANESASVHEYLVHAQLAATELALKHGFNLHYAELPNSPITLSIAS